MNLDNLNESSQLKSHDGAYYDSHGSESSSSSSSSSGSGSGSGMPSDLRVSLLTAGHGPTFEKRKRDESDDVKSGTEPERQGLEYKTVRLIERWYHSLHWTRLVFVGIFGACLFCAIYNDSGGELPLQNIIVGILLFVCAFIAFALVWNYAVTKSLAESAAELEKIVIEVESSIESQRNLVNEAIQQADHLVSTNETLQNRMKVFEQSVSILGGSVAGLDGLESKLSSLTSSNEELMKQRQVIQVQQERFLIEQQIDQLARERDDIMRQIRDQFDEADKDRSGYIDSPIEIAKMKTFLANAKIPWDDKWDADGDGKIEKFELMEGVDHATQTRSDEAKKQLTEQLKQIDEKLKSEAVKP